jgi:HK97 family phage major capsid protein
VQHTPDIEQLLAQVSRQLDQLAPVHSFGQRDARGSRFVGPSAAPAFVERVAAGDTITTVAPTTPSAPATKGIFARDLKALAESTGSAGGYIVPPQLASEIVMAIRSRSAVLGMGVTVVPVAKELDIAGISSGATASFVSENSSIPVSQQSFVSNALLRPKALAALVPVSNRLLRDAATTPALEAVLIRDIAEVIALREDLSFLQGTGSVEPLGITNMTGLTPPPDLGANGSFPDFDLFKAALANMRSINAPMNSPGWILPPAVVSHLDLLKDSDGRYLSEPSLLEFDPQGATGKLLGLPFRVSGQIPTGLTVGTSTNTTYAILGTDWSEAWVGVNESLVIQISGEASYVNSDNTVVSAFQSDQSLFRAVTVVDIGLRRPQLFTVIRGLRLP